MVKNESKKGKKRLRTVKIHRVRMVKNKKMRKKGKKKE